MRKIFLYFFCLSLPLAFVLLCRAQDYSYVQYTEKDGLPSNVVYDILQDRKGFIWMATENGVVRYDGERFKTYTTKDGLPDNTVFILMEDSAGRIWASPFTHLPYYLENERFVPYPFPASVKERVRQITEMYCFDDMIFMNQLETQFILFKDGTVKSAQEFNPLIPPGFLISSGKPSRDFFIIGKDSVAYLITNGKRIKQKKIKPFKNFIWFNDDLEIVVAGYSDKNIIPKRLANRDVICGVGLESAFFFSYQTGKFLYRINAQKTTHAIIDREGNTWITTEGFGVFRYPSVAFRQLRPRYRIPEIFSLGKSDGKILAGGNLGLLHTITDTGYFSSDFSYFNSISGNLHIMANRQTRIMKILPAEKNLYLGSDGWLLKRDMQGNTIAKNYFPVKDIDINGNQMLVCLGVGALLVNPDDLSLKDTLLTERTTAGVIHKDNYYLGTYGGLIVINGQSKTITPLAEKNPLLGKRITRIVKGRHDDLWITTSGSGLIHLRNDRVLNNITEQKGLVSDICTDVFIDKDTLWVATNRGLNKLVFSNDSLLSIFSLSAADGLASNSINAVFTDSQYVYTGTAEGITFFPKNYTASVSAFPLYLMNASRGNEPLKPDSAYTFPHNTINIRFDFSAISYKSAGDIVYLYRLSGLDDVWNSTTNNFINFASLPPGSYTLQVKARNKFRTESNTISIRITITPPWWKTWWFLLSAAGITGLGIFLFYRRRIREIEKKEKLKRETESQFAALEQQALQAQMNPHFIFNCLNSIQSFVIANDVYGANRYLTSFASLIRQTLDNSSQNKILLADEIRYLSTYLGLESMRYEERFSYSIETVSGLNANLLFIPAMLLQPFVENAIRHGIQHRNDNKGYIEIRFSLDKQNNLYCSITDNGVGRQLAGAMKSASHIEYQSRGTQITQKRIDMINTQYQTRIVITTEDVLNEKKETAGTRVNIIFPASFLNS